MTEEQIFLAALEQPDAAARDVYLGEACQGNPELRQSVAKLLAAHFQSGEFLDVPAPHQVEIETSAGEAVTIVSLGLSAELEAPTMKDDDRTGLEFLAPSSRPDSLGRIGHYEVLQVLGKGGFGIVLRAFDDVLQRVVAIKVMAPELAATSPARKRFRREAESSAKVRHENVVQVYEVGEQPLPYLVMEFIPGETLQQRLDRIGPLEVLETVRIGRQIAEGLAAAHAMDLIHRDVKPGNVLLEGGHLKVKLTDFGLARAGDDASMTQSGMIAGTPMYMAPEQVLGQLLDQRADLFSLGTVMYQMAAGRSPFRAPTSVAVLKRVAEDTPRNIREIISETPQWLCDIISKLHAKNPDERYQSAREVADVLADCEEQLKHNSRLQDFSRIPRSESEPAASPFKGTIAAALVLLPLVALAVTELTGVTQLFRRQQPIAAGAPTSQPLVEASSPAAKTPPLAVAPFDAAQARVHQEAWAGHLGVPVELTNSIGMRLRLIPPGRFVMGSSEAEIARNTLDGDEFMKGMIRTEGPQRTVTLTEPFYLGAHEITVGQFRQFVLDQGYKTRAETGKGGRRPNPSRGGFEYGADYIWSNPVEAPSADHPVVQISLPDVRAFCDWLGKREGRTYAVVNEEQWEYACRAGTTTRWYSGNTEDTLDSAAWLYINSRNKTQPVGTKQPNAFGLCDMLGNVEELCLARDGQVVLRGGNTQYRALLARSATRLPVTIDYHYRNGFRVALVEFAARELKDLSSRIPAKSLDQLPDTFKNTLGMEFVIVPKGKAWLGGGKGKPADQDEEIPADFYLGKYEVTQEEWEKVMGENPSRFSRKVLKDSVQDVSDADLKRFPVEYVSWDQCQLFVEKLNQLENEKGWSYRLPTEVEWEYACRGGSDLTDSEYQFDYYFDQPTNTAAPNQANFHHGENALNRTCKVGSYKPNRLGLCDMHGNVWEWCQDEVMDKEVSKRPTLGGGWDLDSSNGRAWFRRSPHLPSHRHQSMGLRLARVPVKGEFK